MERATVALSLPILLLATGPVWGQVFSDGDPAGTTLVPFVSMDLEAPEPTGMMWSYTVPPPSR